MERATYLTYGGTESDYRPARWGAFREELRLAGKEEDLEVGLQFHGARYYSPALNTWISPDPLSVHSLESELNVYAYVIGKPLKNTDPLGLRGPDEKGPSNLHSGEWQVGYQRGSVAYAGMRSRVEEAVEKWGEAAQSGDASAAHSLSGALADAMVAYDAARDALSGQLAEGFDSGSAVTASRWPGFVVATAVGKALAESSTPPQLDFVPDFVFKMAPQPVKTIAGVGRVLQKSLRVLKGWKPARHGWKVFPLFVETRAA